MPVQPPTTDTLQTLAGRHGLDLSVADLGVYRQVIEGALASLSRLDELDEPKLPVTFPRDPGHRPPAEENPLNAWAWRCSIEGAADGPLAGKTVALKDNICVAGIPMTNGCGFMDGFRPDIDATIVTRILDAGGTIAGMATCEQLGTSDGSHTSAGGPVPNPHDHTRTTGGSSSGCAALVVTGECDMAVGADQAGSIRMPSSFSGCYGLKPTYSLVPYTGVFEGEYTLDHVGPMASTVEDVALLLSAIAGPDGIDPRQTDVKVGDYLGALEDGIEGMRIGVLEEGFGLSGAEPEVESAVRDATARLGELGAVVESVSIPMHREGPHIWRGIAAEGAFVRQLRGNGQGVGTKAYYNVPMIDAFGEGRARDPNDFSVTVKYVLLFGEYLQEQCGGHYYGKARNLARRLKQEYDDALSRHDLLVMPTTVMRATPLPAPDAPLLEQILRAFEVNDSTCGFNTTGHPAMSIPCARVDGLPVGLMAVGPAFGEAAILRLARACEASFAPPVRISKEDAA